MTAKLALEHEDAVRCKIIDASERSGFKGASPLHTQIQPVAESGMNECLFPHVLRGTCRAEQHRQFRSQSSTLVK